MEPFSFGENFMQKYVRPFQAVEESSQTLAVTGSSQALTLPTPQGNRTIRILTNGSVPVFWKYGTGAAVATSTPILPNTVETFFLPNDVTQISFIAGGTGTTIYITVGQGA